MNKKIEESFMKKERAYILTINGGSSSIKFALYRLGKMPTRSLMGNLTG